MKSLLDAVTSTIAKAALIAFGLVLAGLSVSFMVLLAFFGFAIAGLALLAAPFVGLIQSRERSTDDDATISASA